MLLSSTELQGNLNRLRQHIVTTRCCKIFPAENSARDAAKNMPLSHTTSERALVDIIDAGALLSPTARGGKSRKADIILGGTNDICFYLGSAAFPHNEFGFIFAAELPGVNQAKASSTPFDSGGCLQRYPLPRGSDGVTHVRTHSMPVPECRQYLGDLLTSHYQNCIAYLTGRGFRCPVCLGDLPDPHGMQQVDDLALNRMHEIRIQNRLDLHPPLLIAVLVPENLTSPAYSGLLALGVELIMYEIGGGSDRTYALRHASVDFIRTQLSL